MLYITRFGCVEADYLKGGKRGRGVVVTFLSNFTFKSLKVVTQKLGN